MADHASSSSSTLAPTYTSPATSSFNSDLNLNSELEFDLDIAESPLSPRTLYAQSFDRPGSSQSLPSTRRFRKNMKEMTGFGTTEEEFEALPIAVRRKYFSTLERLRFAQNSRTNALHDLPIQSHRKSSIADRRGVNVALIEPRRSSSRRQRKIARQQSVSSTEASWFLTLPDKIKNKQFSREEQVLLAGRLRESVILDAADEAIYKASRRASRKLPVTPLFDDSRPGTPRSSTDSSRPNIQQENTSNMAAHMYESFRWMDEEQDLDLKLVLDDYHANLDGVVIPTPASARRPSFRRQMSVSKMPFGRNSLSSQPRSPLSPKSEPPLNHGRTRSRTMSLIQPKHVAKLSVATIDPNAAHYQDPEARLKLRVYLASPQKFDEAIEFGFPSMDGMTDITDKENKPPTRMSRDVNGTKKSFGIDRGQSFLNDDMASLFDDDVSMADPESPLTPRGDLGFRSQNQSIANSGPNGSKTSSDFSHLGINKPTLVKQPETYTHAMAGSREMTLRMTLTRPDLRADETTIYGWQRCKSPLSEEPSTSMDEKSEMRGPLGGADGWGPDKESGVVKRFWNKVKSSQRKST
ncbi:hypothetical protein IFR04_001442 [Cadophora malorum]|uniref:Mucin n=1 Tax=Cadophora malorum TaxID=108018 RepID=A0A8H7WIY2_9HELO|nr:hypothetical protein IFR04_001442 [Cadophora malorum]